MRPNLLGEVLALPSSDINCLRFLHWNIHSWQTRKGDDIKRGVSKIIEESQPDVVSLVEVDEQWGMAATLASVGESLGYAWIFAPAFEFGDQAPLGGFGNALLIKPTIHAVQQWQLLWPTKVYNGTEDSEQRAIVFAKIEYDDEIIWVGSTHLPRGDRVARHDALNRIVGICARLVEPWVLCGDFNIPATAWIPDKQRISFSPNPPVPTYPTENPKEAIDYCLHSSGVALEVDVLEAAHSDHLPLLARCCFGVE